MTDIKRMQIFTLVVDTGSFSKAAKRLGIARSAISRHITALERTHGVRLLNRTTRHLSLTEAGRIYYESCTRIAAEADALSQRLHQLREQPTGTLRVAGPTSFATQLAALVQAFQKQHPGVTVELRLDDRVIDMVDEGIDVSVRIGWLEDSRLIARRICDAPRIICAAPGYLERRGRPKTPAQLTGHECIIFTLLPTPYQWHFSHRGQHETIHVKGHLLTNSTIALRELVKGGAGIAPLSRFMVSEDIRAGRLEPLLEKYDCGSAGIYAVYQDRRYQQPKVRLFIECLMKRLPPLV
ncbi:MAG TPA: LysR family transcriptional regulator [Gammaproteobacteria bacterium]|nr:LysR family transcriptional regulator [Gammaproteobacteria bacterium]